jgi:hypothetical protein
MSNKGIVFLSFAATLLFTLSASSQEKELGTEVVNIVKPYTPTISDAFKVKETPSLTDSTTTLKKDVKYSIFSVPVASTFTPAKGKATNVEKVKREKTYDNYATLGFGNYTSILGELYSNFEISNTDNVGFFFRHNSSQGDIKNVKLDNKFYDTSLDANYTSRQRGITYGVDFGVEHQLYNWYGIDDNLSYTPTIINQIEPQHSFFSGYLGGNIALEDSFFEKAALNIRYMGDSFSSSEINATLKPEFSFPIESLNFKIEGDIDYLAGSFDRNYTNTSKIDYSYLNAGLAPSISFVNNDLSVSLGVAAYVSMDTENSNTDFSLYPRLNASYRLMDETVIVYGGVEGGLLQNTYYNFKEQNPFISPTLYILPTKNVYEGFAGVKGKLTNSVAYNLRVSYGQDENRALFQANPLKTVVTGLEGYEYGNSFNVVYDDVNTLSVFGEVKVAVSDQFSLGINATYNNDNTDVQAQAWNLPELQATLFSDFKITDKLYGGASIFYMGERKDLVSYVNFNNAQEVTLDGYVDANIHFGYRFTDRLSAFVKGNNLFSDNYTKWMNYPVQGIQGLIGATYKFDW